MVHAHLIGIGGSGLSAIARILLENGYEVSGSDLERSDYARVLEKMGAEVFTGHHPEQIQGADFILLSSAIPPNNVELLAAEQSGIPIYRRSEFLGDLTANKFCIAVAGTHGKTTTTAMISWILSKLEQDPSYIIGGISKNLATNAHAGKGQSFVIEADEYDRMFLGLRPQLAVITNIEHDHPDIFPTEQDFFTAFMDFVHGIREHGYLLACTDDLRTSELVDITAKERDIKIYSYGLDMNRDDTSPDYVGRNLTNNEKGSFSYEFFFREEFLVQVNLSIPGMHNVRNSLASLAVANIMDLPVAEAASALSEFEGTERRFEIRGEVSGVTIIDDYAHHPTEIQATLEAAHLRYPNRSLWAVWQPHTYTRTEKLFDDYLNSFEHADHVLITEIYPSREKYRDDISAQQLVQAMEHSDAKFFPGKFQVVDYLVNYLEPGDVVLVLSAGDANQISSMVYERLSSNGNAK